MYSNNSYLILSLFKCTETKYYWFDNFANDLVILSISGETVDEVTAYAKKHDAFEKLLGTQEEKILALQEHGDKLLAQKHFESDLIARRLIEVVQRRAKVKELCALRKQRLDDALLYAQFMRDVGEVSLHIQHCAIKWGFCALLLNHLCQMASIFSLNVTTVQHSEI